MKLYADPGVLCVAFGDRQFDVVDGVVEIPNDLVMDPAAPFTYKTVIAGHGVHLEPPVRDDAPADAPADDSQAKRRRR